MHTYAHSYYISCSYVRVVFRPEEVHSSGWKLVFFNQFNVLLWEYIQLFYEKFYIGQRAPRVFGIVLLTVALPCHMVVGLTGLWGTQMLHYSNSNIPLLVLCGQSFVWLGASEGRPCIQRHLSIFFYHIQTLLLYFEPSVTCLCWYLVDLIGSHLCNQGGMLQVQAQECVLHSHKDHSI